MRMGALAMEKGQLRHLPWTERNDRSGTYDAQKGDEVVTISCQGPRGPANLVVVLHRLATGALLSVALAGLLAACGGTGSAPPGSKASHAAAAPVKVRRCKAGTARVGSSAVAVAAIVRSHATAYRRPGRRPFARFGRLNQNDYPTVFRVLAAVRRAGCRPVWYRVQLPLRPNGVQGFVRASAVRVGSVRTRIVVDVSSRQLVFYRRGRAELRTTVAVGASATPTPTGSFYVNQRLIPADPGGPYGPGAIGISAFSDVLTGWAQGGPVAIHGTNEPWSIGHPVSNGCIRVRNPVLRRLFAQTPAGTPVVIRS
jgi:lipoprotein-anchoring transpeptidase ErfK/SrfK